MIAIEACCREVLIAPLEASEKVILAVSGGADSMAMMLAIARLLERDDMAPFRKQIFVGHVLHVGPIGNPWRDTCAEHVRSAAERLGLAITVERSRFSESESEASLRDVRYQALESIAESVGARSVLLAHHKDDLLETRLMRFLRGTGHAGLEAMRLKTHTTSGLKLLRPLLTVWRKDLLIDFERLRDEFRSASTFEIDALEDPSNQDLKYLRNAVREKLIPLLNDLRPGGKDTFARSLDRLAREWSDREGDGLGSDSESFARSVAEPSLSRAQLIQRDREARADRIAAFARKHNVPLTMSLALEVSKRIETPRKSISFQVGGVLWTLDPQELKLAPTEGVFEAVKL